MQSRKGCKTCLTNHTQVYITTYHAISLVINAVGGRHTDTGFSLKLLQLLRFHQCKGIIIPCSDACSLLTPFAVSSLATCKLKLL